jgi:thymidylate synthase
MVAAQAGLGLGELIWTGGDTHLYLNHAHLVEEQLGRVPSGEPRLRLLRRPETIFEYVFEDFEVPDYHPQGAIRAPVAV